MTIDVEAVRRLSKGLGIDTVTALAERSGVPRWTLYRSMRSGTMKPSHANAVAEALGVEAAALSGDGQS